MLTITITISRRKAQPITIPAIATAELSASPLTVSGISIVYQIKIIIFHSTALKSNEKEHVTLFAESNISKI